MGENKAKQNKKQPADIVTYSRGPKRGSRHLALGQPTSGPGTAKNLLTLTKWEQLL